MFLLHDSSRATACSATLLKLMVSQTLQALYGILTEDGLRERQTEAVEQVSALLGIPEDDAEHLLRQFKWCAS